MSDLKLCPCCGGTAFLDKDEIFCDMCGLRMPFPVYEYGAVDGVDGFPTWEQAREEAVRRWNERKIKELVCEITIESEDVLHSALNKLEVDGKSLAEWLELLKGYKQLEAELVAVKRERDAAVADLSFGVIKCDVCKHGRFFGNDCIGLFGDGGCSFEWRGVCPETEVQDNG